MTSLEIRKTGASFWEVFHTPTDKAIAPSLKEVYCSYGKNKKADVLKFYNRIKDAFPWHEWTRDYQPEWANDAYRLIKNITA